MLYKLLLFRFSQWMLTIASASLWLDPTSVMGECYARDFVDLCSTLERKILG